MAVSPHRKISISEWCREEPHPQRGKPILDPQVCHQFTMEAFISSSCKLNLLGFPADMMASVQCADSVPSKGSGNRAVWRWPGAELGARSAVIL